MWGLGAFGILCLFVGFMAVRTHIKRSRWPIVDATLDSLEGHVDATPTGEDIAIQPRFVHQLNYIYKGRSYSVEVTDREIHARSLVLRVNPERPEEALFEDKGLVLPIVAICTGLVLIAVVVMNAV